jgi:hypothetical protein
VKFAKEHVGLTNPLVAEDVYRYWMQKRTRLRKPLLRRFWPVTASNDTNPHMVFRPREKERYKLRKHRRNDMEALLKMRQLRDELQHARKLVGDVRQREKLKRELLLVGEDVFEQVRPATGRGLSMGRSHTGLQAIGGGEAGH